MPAKLTSSPLLPSPCILARDARFWATFPASRFAFLFCCSFLARDACFLPRFPASRVGKSPVDSLGWLSDWLSGWLFGWLSGLVVWLVVCGVSGVDSVGSFVLFAVSEAHDAHFRGDSVFCGTDEEQPLGDEVWDQDHVVPVWYRLNESIPCQHEV